MTKIFGMIFISIGVSGCMESVLIDEPAGTLPPGMVARAGSRLQLRVVQAKDGIQIPVGFHDTLLDVDCTPQPSGGILRCLPAMPTATDFADEACAIPAVSPNGCSQRPRYATVRADICTATSSPVVREITGLVQQLYTSSTAGCSTKEAQGAAGWAVGSEDVTARFVAFEERRRPLGARLDRIVWVSPDGAEWQSSVLYDRQLGLECTLGTAIDGSRRCLPIEGAVSPGVAGLSEFTDATCSTPLMPGGVCGALKAQRTTQLCQGTRTYRAGRAHEGPVYRKSAEGCVMKQSDDQARFVAEELLPGQLAEVLTEIRPGGVRIDRIDGQPFVAGFDSLVDPATGERCNLMSSAGGPLQCAPYEMVRFADPACTRPIVVAPDSCAPRRAFEARWETCGASITALYDVGAETSPSTLYGRAGDGSCSLAEVRRNVRFFEARPIPLGRIASYEPKILGP